MRQSGPATIRDSATVGLAEAPPTYRTLTDVLVWTASHPHGFMALRINLTILRRAYVAFFDQVLFVKFRASCRFEILRNRDRKLVIRESGFRQLLAGDVQC
jgi:hypothetical protein